MSCPIRFLIMAKVQLPETRVNFAFVIAFSLILFIGLRRLPLTYTLYVAPQLLLLACRQNAATPLLATSRYVLVLFPAFVVLVSLTLHGYPRLHLLWLSLSLSLLAFCTTLYVLGWFVA